MVAQDRRQEAPLPEGDAMRAPLTITLKPQPAQARRRRPVTDLRGYAGTDTFSASRAGGTGARGAGWSFGAIPVLPGGLQRKLAIGQANDPLEHEADRVAERVMRMPAAPVSATPVSATSGPVQLARKCAACEAEEHEIQRAATPGASQASASSAGQAPGIVHDVLRAPGQRLDAGTRSFFEPRFGQDFSRVRIHAEDRAAASAAAVQARAFTVGEHVVFGRGEYAPASPGGRMLLAHELAHVVQQGAGASPQRLQRRLVVDPNAVAPLPPGIAGPPDTLTHTVENFLGTICPDGGATVNGKTGVASLATAGFCGPAGAPHPKGMLKADTTANPVGCHCLCDVIASGQTTTVSFRAGPPSTDPGTGAGVPPGTMPGTGGHPSSPTVNIDPRFQGQYKINNKWVDIPFELIFAHELCGHAASLMAGTQVPPGPGPAGGTPPHEVRAVAVEQAIAAEQGQPIRPADYSGAARQRP